MSRDIFFQPIKELSEHFVRTAHQPQDWVESSVDVRDTHGRQYLGVTISQQVRTISFIIILATLGIFFFKSAQLQVVQGQGLFALSQKNKLREYIIPAHRGTIFDRNGRRLVSNAADFAVMLDPKGLPSNSDKRTEILDLISKKLTIDTHEIENAISNAAAAGGTALLRDNVSREDTLLLTAAFAGVAGVEIVPEEIRNYELGSVKSLAHILGYTGRITRDEFDKNRDTYFLNDKIGKDGVELSYEQELRGVFGKKQVEIDALGNPHDVVGELKARDGSNLILTIDYAMQKEAEEFLSETLDLFGKKKGVVIVTDPRNGEILAYVNLPAYDNNIFSKGISQQEYAALLNDPDRPLFARGLRGDYPSGSTIKMLVAGAALAEGIITPTTSVVSSGGIRIGQWLFPDWKAGGHGRTNVIKALAESVNTFFYYIGGGYDNFEGLGVDRLVAYFEKFGIGSKTGIDLPNEAVGFVPSPEWKLKKKGERWYIGDTYHIAIGQGDVLVAPLQVNLYTAYFANGGKNYIPHVVKRIEGAGLPEKNREIIPRVYRSDVLPPDATETVRQGLREAVMSGSARRLSLLPIEAAGKTGTAQWSTDKAPHAWFTGWAPFNDPRLVITVLIEEGEEGSKSAILAAYNFLSWYYRDYLPLLDKAP